MSSATKMNPLHRAIRLVCVVGAGAAPIFMAILCRQFAQIANEQFLSRSAHQELPLLTQAWIVDLAGGNLPLVPVALLLSVVILAAGVFFVFTKRITNETASSGTIAVCCVGYTVGIVIAGSTLLGLAVPFLSGTTG
jgi:hypothetical protein